MTLFAPSPVHQDNLRRDARRAIDEIMRCWPHALLDAQSVGYPGGRADDHPDAKGRVSDPTGHAAINEAAGAGTPAVGWLAQAHDVLMACVNGDQLVGLAFAGPSKQLAEIWKASLDHAPPDLTVYEALFDLADRGSYWWPKPPKKGQVVDGVTVGERANDVQTCGLCNEPVIPGKDPDTGRARLRRIDGQAFHGTGPNCYWTVARQRKAAAK